MNVSVIVPTYDRAASLRRCLTALLAQNAGGCQFEILIVDNNSTDETAAVVQEVMHQQSPVVRYLLETAQGVSYARNAGIAASRAPILAFVDDDVRVEPDWIATIWSLFEQHPDIECVGGKVLPNWQAPPPAWLTRKHWAPLALLDFGESALRIDASNRLCLLTANLACRRTVFDRVGPFRTEMQRVKDGIGSMEDHDWLVRFWAAGGRALYVPRLRAHADVPASRMTRAYHRRWHAGHGHYFALLQDPEFESSRVGRFMDVPAHAYRAAVREAFRWGARALTGNRNGAFASETRLRFFLGYFHTRWSAYRSGNRVHGHPAVSSR